MWPVGHDRAVQVLRQAVESGRVSHSYLFTGPERVGKTTLAIALAQALNCSQSAPPCGECRSCKLIAARRHPDVRLIRPAADEEAAGEAEVKPKSRGGHLITIDQIRSLQHDASLLPYEGRHKVYIIREAEKMRTETHNCLLKTLEEPPPAVVLLLTTTSASMLPPTVLSRCQQLSLGVLSTETVERALRERWGVEADKAHQLAHYCAGHIGWAIEAAGDEEVVSERARQLDILRQLVRGTYGERFGVAERLASKYSQDPDTTASVLDLWSGWWRDLLLVKGNCSELITNVDCAGDLAELAERWPFEQIHAFIGAIQATRQYLYHNVNPRLALEVLMLSMPSTRAQTRTAEVGRL